MKTVVITGSTRGIGLGLAKEFLKRGHQVVISGRDQDFVDQTVSGLSQNFDPDLLMGIACDVTIVNQVQVLWDAGKAHFGKIDIWINNAGMAHALIDTWDLPEELIKQEIEVNITGSIFGIKVAVTGMLEQGHGAVYLMEGHGSTGRVQKGLTLYGTTKSAIAYLTKSLAAELEGTPVIAASLSPGMVVTDLLTIQREHDPEGWERSKKIFNILAEKVETVTPVLVEGILSNGKNGARISYSGRWKLMWRFLTAGFSKRDLFEKGE
jgi:NAD(P)-dependent dehydrogenase (short-subunit alcohol dehydrogenase family)